DENGDSTWVEEEEGVSQELEIKLGEHDTPLLITIHYSSGAVENLPSGPSLCFKHIHRRAVALNFDDNTFLLKFKHSKDILDILPYFKSFSQPLFSLPDPIPDSSIEYFSPKSMPSPVLIQPEIERSLNIESSSKVDDHKLTTISSQDDSIEATAPSSQKKSRGHRSIDDQEDQINISSNVHDSLSDSVPSDNWKELSWLEIKSISPRKQPITESSKTQNPKIDHSIEKETHSIEKETHSIEKETHSSHDILRARNGSHPSSDVDEEMKQRQEVMSIIHAHMDLAEKEKFSTKTNPILKLERAVESKTVEQEKEKEGEKKVEEIDEESTSHSIDTKQDKIHNLTHPKVQSSHASPEDYSLLYQDIVDYRRKLSDMQIYLDGFTRSTLQFLSINRNGVSKVRKKYLQLRKAYKIDKFKYYKALFKARAAVQPDDSNLVQWQEWQQDIKRLKRVAPLDQNNVLKLEPSQYQEIGIRSRSYKTSQAKTPISISSPHYSPMASTFPMLFHSPAGKFVHSLSRISPSTSTFSSSPSSSTQPFFSSFSIYSHLLSSRRKCLHRLSLSLAPTTLWNGFLFPLPIVSPLSLFPSSQPSHHLSLDSFVSSSSPHQHIIDKKTTPSTISPSVQLLFDGVVSLCSGNKISGASTMLNHGWQHERLSSSMKEMPGMEQGEDDSSRDSHSKNSTMMSDHQKEKQSRSTPGKSNLHGPLFSHVVQTMRKDQIEVKKERKRRELVKKEER
ncbi:hypothetical protein ADUPG1_011296, partial [Aduncisulcus paluster]